MLDCMVLLLHTASTCDAPGRWEQGVQAELLQHPALTAGPLDLLVLDNTYCHPR